MINVFVVLKIALIASILFMAVLVFISFGKRMRRRSKERASMSMIEGAVFSLIGLLIAFTFSGGAARFEARRDLIVEETNAISTAWLRIDLLPAAAQPVVRDDFRAYLDARIKFYRDLDLKAKFDDIHTYVELQDKIWKETIAACTAGCPGSSINIVAPALNTMFDITTTRSAAMEMHPPTLIFFGLGAILLLGALFAGYELGGSSERHWMHMLLFAAMLAVSVYIILDLEYPRFGLIRVEAMDHLLIDLRATMNQPN